MSTEKLKSLDVVDANGEKIGNIKDVLVDEDGEMRYALLGTAGMLGALGIEQKLMPIPIDAFHFEQNKLRLDVDKDRFKDAPSFSPYQPPDFSRDYETKIHQFWGYQPYFGRPTYHFEQKTVGDVMTKDMVTLTTHTPVDQALKLMSDRGMGELPVVDEQGRVVGMVMARDLLRMLSSSLTGEMTTGEMTRPVQTETKAREEQVEEKVPEEVRTR
jgi:hypothetical protein